MSAPVADSLKEGEGKYFHWYVHYWIPPAARWLPQIKIIVSEGRIKLDISEDTDQWRTWKLNSGWTSK